jgi:uncharacterized tellurite resistance protein B-like protein
MESSSINLSGRGSPIQLSDSDRPQAETPQGFAADVAGLSQTASTETFGQQGAAAPGQALRMSYDPDPEFRFEAFCELWKKIVAEGGQDERQMRVLWRYRPASENFPEIVDNIDIFDRSDRMTALRVLVKIAEDCRVCKAILNMRSQNSAWLENFDEAQRTDVIMLLVSINPNPIDS